MNYTAETLAVARENLISLGVFRPTVDEILKEAQRLHEANKVTPRITKLLLPLLAPAVSPETVAEFLRTLLNI